ncbi:uncharacterized protein FIBRA_01000 [Fibroporia radiculosa]|uniref:Uncharacterized protein n=1 Tax=Fibroporia radiculosa TaxID=599839 RepID=J4HSL2_9APHY|nr:uncharacterized protein FIBRA_01000 [Fibroporia radiculosa]CCL98992.1 predicted protein [Fibroporia radiculosa]
MADSQRRAPLQPSATLYPSTSDTLSRGAKGRIVASTSDPAYFIPSAATFRPRPYQPQNATHSSQSSSCEVPEKPSHASISTRIQLTRQHSLSTSVTPSFDPLPSDPGVVFLHPPFTDFPDAHKFKDGLTYNLMAANPEWFLDPADFLSANSTNPDAIQYPSQLEPPRGWCPTKKKDLKGGTFPEGEEPRLRCTFCRRCYAGVNAKSMWRRHVLEKHLVAMANRRETGDRKGGRGSNKENGAEKGNIRNNARGGRRAFSGEPTKQEHIPEAWRLPLVPGAQLEDEPEDNSDEFGGPLPQISNDGTVGPELEMDFFSAVASSSTPPLTPGFTPSKSTLSHQNIRDALVESPYDPLVTPLGFRHSPRRLPSDQPWRFPSPSHPLHSKARELSLCMLVRGEASPVVNGLEVSPAIFVSTSERSGKRSLFGSPFDLSFSAPSPRRLFHEPPKPLLDRAPFKEFKVPESPFERSSHKRALSNLSDAWPSDLSLSPVKLPGDGSGLLEPIRLQGEDPFTDGLYNSWLNIGESPRGRIPPKPILDESPVIRKGHQQVGMASVKTKKISSGLTNFGAGLMDAFLSGKDISNTVESSDDDGSALIGGGLDGSPVKAGKKTRRGSWFRDDDGDTEMSEVHPRKRRKTIGGRT